MKVKLPINNETIVEIDTIKEVGKGYYKEGLIISFGFNNQCNIRLVKTNREALRNVIRQFDLGITITIWNKNWYVYYRGQSYLWRDDSIVLPSRLGNGTF